jgi:pimeloyl-ACP methyl ester carboxylesterase
MKIELVEATTTDELIHAGAFLEAAQPTNSVPGADVVLMMHGNSSNFYQPFYRYFAEELSRRGCPSLRTNNRGHDVVSRATGSRNLVSTVESFHAQDAQFFGTAYEKLDDCRLDWDAWITYLWKRGYRKILLWGHSRGAVKTGYYMGITNDPRVAACILASPPWFSYSRWMRSEQAALFQANLSEAQSWVDRGEPNRLIRAKVPMEYMSGAANYLDKYGPDERYNVMRYVGDIKTPVLAITGTIEVEKRFGFGGLPEAFAKVRESKPNLTHVSIEGGDHYYTGCQEYVLGRVLEWLREIGD